MKKYALLAFATLLATSVANAEEYGYFSVRNANGEVTTFTAVGLKMTFADGKLIATQDGLTTELPIDALNAMYFSDRQTTAIGNVTRADDHVIVYNLSGMRIAEGRMDSLNLPKGLYIVSKNGTQTKVMVR